jgi:iron complex transport system substrate-binding protein
MNTLFSSLNKLLAFGALLLSSLTAAAAPAPRIVSLNGTISEIICDLGRQGQLVGVDVTSTYPTALEKLPKVGHTRNISAEGVLAQNPSLVVGTTESLKPEVAAQLKSAGVRVELFKHAYSVEGTKQLIKEVAAAFGATAEVPALLKKLDAQLTQVRRPAKSPKVLFIYARGTGTMMAKTPLRASRSLSPSRPKPSWPPTPTCCCSSTAACKAWAARPACCKCPASPKRPPAAPAAWSRWMGSF